MVEKPDLDRDGIILLEGAAVEALPSPLPQPDRFVVLAHRDVKGLARIWNAGIHHVVFEDDPPSTVQLAVIAAELRSSNAARGRTRNVRQANPVKASHTLQDCGNVYPVL